MLFHLHSSAGENYEDDGGVPQDSHKRYGPVEKGKNNHNLKLKLNNLYC